jgi:hypothetical protein
MTALPVGITPVFHASKKKMYSRPELCQVIPTGQGYIIRILLSKASKETTIFFYKKRQTYKSASSFASFPF